MGPVDFDYLLGLILLPYPGYHLLLMTGSGLDLAHGSGPVVSKYKITMLLLQL